MKIAAIVLVGIIGIVGLIFGLAFLLAYPTMWLVNYLFSATFLTFVFGTAKLSVWQALVLNAVSGILFKSTTVSNSSK